MTDRERNHTTGTGHGGIAQETPRCGSIAWRTLVLVAAAAAVGIVLASLPWIPSWRAGIAFGLISAATVIPVWVIRYVLRCRRTDRPWRLVAAVGAGVIGTLCVWLAAAERLSPVPLRSEDLVAELRDLRSGRWVRVYELSEVPNGFIHSRVAVADRWLPIEHDLMTLTEPYHDSRAGDDGLELWFGVTGELHLRYLDDRLVPIVRGQLSTDPVDLHQQGLVTDLLKRISALLPGPGAKDG